MFFKKYILEENYRIFIKKILRRVKIKKFFYVVFFWFFTIVSAFFSLLTSVVSTLRLAPNTIGFFKNILNFFVIEESGGKTKDVWPIFIIYMSLGMSLSSGFLGFFLIKEKITELSKMDSAISLEKELYNKNLGKYSYLNKDYEFFKKLCFITNISNSYIRRKKK